MARKKKVGKKRVSLASVAVLLIASGSYTIQQGNAAGGVILIILGLAILLAAKYVEE